MTDTQLKERFIEILKFNMLEPTIDPEDGNFEDHLSIQLWKFFTNELAKARAEERVRIVGEIPNLLHKYGKWLLENSNAEPLERRAKKQLIATSLLDEEITKKD